MSSKIKVDTIENVAGSGNVSLGSGHNLVVPGNNSTTGNATVGGTLGVTGVSTFSGNIGKVSSGLSPEIDIHVKTASGNPEVRVESTGANYATYGLKNSSRVYSTQIRTDQSNAYVVRDETGGANRLLIDTSGRVTLPNQPAFMAFKVGNQTIGAATTQVTGWNANLDVGSNWDNSQNRYTVPTAGIYLAGGFYQASGTTGLHFGILKNGGAYGNDSFLDVVDASANGYSVPFSMAANDYFTWIAYNSVTKTINANRSKIWVIKVA